MAIDTSIHANVFLCFHTEFSFTELKIRVLVFNCVSSQKLSSDDKNEIGKRLIFHAYVLWKLAFAGNNTFISFLKYVHNLIFEKKFNI